MILLCYDGSSDARSAIDRAGELLSRQPATVLTVWEPFIDVMARTGTGLGMGALPRTSRRSTPAASRRHANGRPRVSSMPGAPAWTPSHAPGMRGATIAHTILTEADQVSADAIVLGSRGLTGLKSLLLGSVSHALLQHADRTVIVVPSPEVAAERAAHRR